MINIEDLLARAKKCDQLGVTNSHNLIRDLAAALEEASPAVRIQREWIERTERAEADARVTKYERDAALAEVKRLRDNGKRVISMLCDQCLLKLDK